MLLPSHEKVLYSQFQVSNSKTVVCRSWTPAPSSSSDNSHGSTYENFTTVKKGYASTARERVQIYYQNRDLIKRIAWKAFFILLSTCLKIFLKIFLCTIQQFVIMNNIINSYFSKLKAAAPEINSGAHGEKLLILKYY